MGQCLLTGHSLPGNHTVVVTIANICTQFDWVSAKKKRPCLFDKQGTDEVFGLLCDLFKALLAKLPLSSCDKGQSLSIIAALERRLPAESTERGRHLQYNGTCTHTTRWK